MKYKNLIPIRDHKTAVRLGRAGGLRKSRTKRISSRINGLMNSKKLSNEQRHMLALLKDRCFIDLIAELISMNLQEIHDPQRRDKTIEQLSKFLPSRTINLDLSPENTEWSDKFELLKSAVVEVCSPEQIKLILSKLKKGENGRRDI